MKSSNKPVLITSTLLVFILTCIFLLGACGQKKQQQMPPPEVGTVTLRNQSVVLTTELPGRTTAYLVAEVRPQVSGIIQKRLFEEGALVKKGDVLYQIDPAPFKAAYDSAQASLGRSKANIMAVRSRAERYRELLASKAVSQQDVDDANSSLNQAEADVKYWKAAVETARINLGYTKVIASISGRIGKSNMNEGGLVTANQPTPLAIVQQFDPIYVDVPQSTSELLRLRRRMEGGILSQNITGQKKVKLIMEDGTAYSKEGILQFRDVTVDTTTGTVTLRAVFPNPERLLLPGMFVRAVVQEGVNNKAILLPQQAVSRDPKGNPLALIVDGKGTVQQREIKLDRAIGDAWLVTSGLVEGERVIVEGIQKVKPGIPVRIVNLKDDTQNNVKIDNTAPPVKAN